jgi:hypothetical protein
MDPLFTAYLALAYNFGAHVCAFICYFLTSRNSLYLDIGKFKRVRFANVIYGGYCLLLLLVSVILGGIAAFVGALLACVICIYYVGSAQADGL